MYRRLRTAASPCREIDALRRGFIAYTLAVGLLPSTLMAANTGAQIEPVEELVVVANGSLRARLGEAASVDMLLEETLHRVAATHPAESLSRLPGVWISRGSGQEHLVALRSGVMTGAGACGALLLLEDGIPIRPAGFCNVNGLFELNTGQAQALEVWRGPGSAVLGGNAMRGAINRVSGPVEQPRASLDVGSYGFYRLSAETGFQMGGSRLDVAMQGTGSDGYRDNTGYGHQHLVLAHQTTFADWDVRSTLVGSNLNQETGGFVQGLDAYKNSELRHSNPNPEAYRDARAMRLSSHWRRAGWRISPYARLSRMKFLQHFLPGQPQEENGQTSAGLLLTFENQQQRLNYRLGSQVEWMDGYLREYQSGETTGSDFLVGTRPSGLHYDFSVQSLMTAVFADMQWALNSSSQIAGNIRWERLHFDYDNHFRTGNSRADGSQCGFGGCLYTRPASRDDTFGELSGRVTLSRRLADAGKLYGTLGTGFRPPQVTELYRLQSGQTVADLQPERIISGELGMRTDHLHIALFADRARNVIIRDAEGFNVSDGRTQAVGIELGWQHQWRTHHLALNLSYAEHRYDFDRAISGGELIESGNIVDTAPRWLGNLTWLLKPRAGIESELELALVGAHFINAANTARYDGHMVANWRLAFKPDNKLSYYIRVLNLLNTRYADRADFAFGNYRYFPAMPRQIYIGVEVTLPGS